MNARVTIEVQQDRTALAVQRVYLDLLRRAIGAAEDGRPKQAELLEELMGSLEHFYPDATAPIRQTLDMLAREPANETEELA